MTRKMTLISLLFSLVLSCSAHVTKSEKKQSSAKKTKKLHLRKRQALVMRRKKAENKTMSHMDFDELEVLKKRLVDEDKNYMAAIKCIEKQEKLCKDSDIMAMLMLEKADCHLKQGNYNTAGELYRGFIELYPGNPHVEKSHRLAIQCFKERILSFDRDQSTTKTVIELCEKYLERGDIYVTYTDEIKKIRVDCYKLLVESEVNVFDYYLNSGKFLSAQTRLDNIKKDYLQEMPDMEPHIMLLDIKLAQAQNQSEEIKQKQLELEQKYPTVQAIEVAQNKKTKKSKVDRF